METVCNYWFMIEPYVFVGMSSQSVLLYNTLDGVSLESDKNEVVELLSDLLVVENCGVVLLTNERYNQKDIKYFIRELREKYMGDVIDVSLSKGKPIQLLPYFNFQNKLGIYKKHNFPSFKNALESLFEISIHLDSTSDVTKLIPFLKSIPGAPIFNIIGDIWEVHNCEKLFDYLNTVLSLKIICCSYKNKINLRRDLDNNFSFKILIDFPIDLQKWKEMRLSLLNHNLPIEYVFEVSSEDEVEMAEQFIGKFHIKKYRLDPIFTGENNCFFEDYIFLDKEDILAVPMSIKDFFIHQSMNIYDFGKINIMPNGDAYANLNYPSLGNIYKDDIYEIVQNEIDEGESWFRVRNQAPCNDCVYQWICPSPSNYEIVLRRPNLCHVKLGVTK